MTSTSDKKNNSDDSSLFKDAIGDIKQIKNDRVVHDKLKPSAKPLQRIADEKKVLEDMLSSQNGDIETGDELSYKLPGVQKRTLKKLKQGQLTVEKELDLHGFNSDQARQKIADFVNVSKAQGLRCLKIIHGKGITRKEGPILKPQVDSWLRKRSDVLAFCSARQNDGGTGAVYVLLKKK